MDRGIAMKTGRVDNRKMTHPHDDWIAEARQEFEVVRSNAETIASARPWSDDEPGLREVLARHLPDYELGAEISRGGQGIVLRAIQKGTRRDVAVKVLRAGPLAGPQDRARFEQEVLLLAQLKHPHIVTILSSGVAGGHFYYVMDFIRGLPFDQFVRENQLSIRETLAVFEKVCDAVNVAHLRGVIHRDLKPGNILIDQSGRPHVMDFGLAKVSEFDALADGVARTITGQFVGSLPWASPEHAEARGELFDIRTDVYSLGVVLYQGLTHRFPYDLSGGMRDVLNRICHTDPVHPRTRNREIDDEVEHIVLRCLQKEPARRYQSAGDIARDIRRYLAGEAIEAKGDSSWYVFKKAVKRNKGRAVAVALLFLLILQGAVGLGIMYQRERNLRRVADAARSEAERQTKITRSVNDFLNEDILAAAAPDALGRKATIREAIDASAGAIARRFDDEPVVAAEVHFTLGNTYLKLGENEEAERHFRTSARLSESALGPEDSNTLAALNDLARVLIETGEFEEARAIFDRNLDIQRRTLGEEHEETMTTVANLGWLLGRIGRYDEADVLCRNAYESRLRLFGPEHPETVTAMSNLAMLYVQQGRLAEAEPLLKKDMDISRRTLGADHPGVLVSISNMATLYADMGRHDEAEKLHLEGIAARKRVLGPAHSKTLLQMNNLAVLYKNMGRYADSQRLLEEALSLGRKEHGDTNPIVVTLFSNLARAYTIGGRFADAEPLHKKAVDGTREIFPPDHPNLGLYLSRQAAALIGLERFNEAETALLEAYPILVNAHGEDHGFVTEAASSLITVYEKLGRSESADEWRQKMPIPPS